MEDDQKTTKPPNDLDDCLVPHSQEDRRKRPDSEEENQEESAPPSCRRIGSRSPPARRESTRGYSKRMVTLEPASGRLRADNIDEQTRLNCLVNDDSFGRKVSGHITVNGVKLTDIQKDRIKSLNKKTTSVKKPAKKTTKKIQSPAPSMNSIGSIHKYLVKKKAGGETKIKGAANKSPPSTSINQSHNNLKTTTIISNEDKVNDVIQGDTVPASPTPPPGMKLTFGTVVRQSVKENILKFQELQRGGKCVMGSGRCAEHNRKLVRTVTMKKVSEKDEKGGTKWVMREVTTLTCPGSTVGRPEDRSSAQTEISTESGVTNKKRRLYSRIGMNQPREEEPEVRKKEDILLDRTK